MLSCAFVFVILHRYCSPPTIKFSPGHIENLEVKVMREYTLIVKGKRIPVTYDVYKTYYQEYEHERYLKNKSAKHEHSLEQCIETNVSIKFICPTV